MKWGITKNTEKDKKRKNKNKEITKQTQIQN
jgi:hypothetical protein